MRVIRSAALVGTLVYAGLATPAPAKSNDPDARSAGGGTLPAGWHARTDKNKSLADAKIATMGGGIHVTLGPAVILWRARDLAARNYRVVATFTQTKNPHHPEAYGLFIGGRHLPHAPKPHTFILGAGGGQVLVQGP